MWSIPSHLPHRLAICYFGHDWLSASLPGDHFADLERVVAETKDRGYNCIRAEMGLDWMFDIEGRRRGPVELTDWVPGASSNLHCMDGKGGARYDVFDRVIRLFELAKQHDLYVITTTWTYSESTPWLAEQSIRDEIFAVPVERRLLHMAEQYHRLLTALKGRDLHRHIAFVEVHNEIIHDNFPLGEANKQAAREAIAFLRERHPDLLVTVDYSQLIPEMVPDNAQVVDHHVYVQGLMQAILRKAGIGWGQGVPDPEHNALLRWLLKPDPMPWKEFLPRVERVARYSLWGSNAALMWFYDNLDVERYDWWCLRHYGEYVPLMEFDLQQRFRAAGDFSAKVDLPAVVDEGYVLYPPRRSHFVQTAAGRWIARTAVESAIAANHWGILAEDYFRPNTLSWNDEREIASIRELNQRIIES